MSVLSLPEAKVHLGIKQTDNDTGVQEAIDSAEAIVAQRVGPLTLGTSSTVRVAGGGALLLPAPVGAVTAVTSIDGTIVDISTLTVNQQAGIAYHTDGITRFSSAAYDVALTRGWDTIPADLMWGIKECLREIWLARRGSGRGTQGPPGKTEWEQWVEPYHFASVSAA